MKVDFFYTIVLGMIIWDNNNIYCLLFRFVQL